MQNQVISNIERFLKIQRFKILIQAEILFQVAQTYAKTNCDHATNYTKRELENILPKWKAILASAKKELSDYREFVKDIPELQHDPKLPVEDYVEDEKRDELNDWAQKERMDVFDSFSQSNNKLSNNDATKEVHDDITDREGEPNPFAVPYEDEGQNAPRGMPSYMSNEFTKGGPSDYRFSDSGRTSARDAFYKFRNDDANRREDERRFRDMVRLLRIRRPQHFRDAGMEYEEAPRMPWTK